MIQDPTQQEKKEAIRKGSPVSISPGKPSTALTTWKEEQIKTLRENLLHCEVIHLEEDLFYIIC